MGKEARSGKLPCTREVLQYFFYRKNTPNFKYKPVSGAICCPLKTGTISSSCGDNPHCSPSSECVVWKLKHEGRWIESGIPIMSDLAITRKIIKLNEEYKKLDKNKAKPNSDKLKREAFVKKLDTLFDISCSDSEDKIKMDRLRNKEAVVEDMRFLDDQRGDRKMVIGTRDLDFDASVGRKVAIDTRVLRMTVKAANNNNEADDSMAEDLNIPNEDINDDDYVVVEKKRRQQDEMVSLTFSRKKLAKETAVTAKRHKIGITAQRDLLANIINVGGGNIEEFSLSNKTVRKAGTVAVKESADEIKRDFKKMCREEHQGEKFIIINFDGKSLAQFHDQVKSVKKRISVIATSPYFSSDQVLAVPITASNSGKDQKEVVVKELMEWEVMPFLFGLGFDTTSDNTGSKRGAVVLIEKEVGYGYGYGYANGHGYSYGYGFGHASPSRPPLTSYDLIFLKFD